MRAWARWVVVRAAASPEAWVRTVSRRLAVSRWRRLRNATVAWRRHGPPTEAPELDANHVALIAALASLPKAQRVAIVLHHLGRRAPWSCQPRTAGCSDCRARTSELGYANRGTVYAIVREALAQEQEANVRQLRQLEGDRLDSLQVALWRRAMNGDLDAARQVFAIIKARCKLYGLEDAVLTGEGSVMPQTLVVPPC